MFAIETRTDDITTQRIQPAPDATVSPGQIRVSIEQLALTANTVTYAVAGFDVGYWKFFPASEQGWGIVPAWGFGRVTESFCNGVEAGQRLYGFWPMAGAVVLTPALRSDGLMDVSGHRAKLPAVYNRYMTAAPAPAPSEPYQSILQPLAATSWLIADWLADTEAFGAQQIVVGSASSKTGLALCRFLASSPLRVVGLTSAANLDFVTAHGMCDQVLSYDDVEEMPRDPSVYVDMAGSLPVKARVHGHLRDVLCHSAAVGLSHWDKFAPPGDLPGPKPEFFFAPAQIAKRRDNWGPGVVEGRIAKAVAGLAAGAGDWLDLCANIGPDAAIDVFQAIAAGKIAPNEGHIVTFEG